jgi:hypothetical protein
MFLDHYLHTMFDLIQPGIFTYFTGYSAGMIYEQNVIEYRTGLQFQNTTVFTSIQNEVDMIIQTAFIPKYIEPLLLQLRSSLPSTNPFSKTTSITFQFNPLPPTKTKQMSPFGIIAITIAVVLMLLFVTFIMWYRYYHWYRTTRRHQTNVPKIIIHTNHDPVHGDLIEIISSSDYDIEPEDVLSSALSSIRQRLIHPITGTTTTTTTSTANAIEIERFDETNSATSTGSQSLYPITKRKTQQAYSDGWRSTTSSSVGSIEALPVKYTEPNIFEDVD